MYKYYVVLSGVCDTPNLVSSVIINSGVIEVKEKITDKKHIDMISEHMWEKADISFKKIIKRNNVHISFYKELL